MSNFAEFTKQFGGEDAVKETQDLENRKEGEFEEVPHGTYEVKITKLELTVGKTSGKLMATSWFKIVNGTYKNSMLFRYQVLETAYGRKIENEFLRSLDSGLEISFDGDFDHYNNLHLDVLGAIDGKKEYQLKYAPNDKNPQYNDFIIEKVFKL